MNTWRPHWQVTRHDPRLGFVHMTARMMIVLDRLHAAGDVYLWLGDVSRRTIRALVERDWIVAGTLRQPLYRITGRGKAAREVFLKPGRRLDGVCPRCCKRPRGWYQTGARKAYCDECLKQAQNRQHALKGRQLDPHGMCATCKQRPRLVRASGDVCIYCAECRRERRKEERRTHQRRLKARIAAGEHVPCIHCDQPRYQTPNHVYDYCYEHYREQQRNYHRRKKAESLKGSK